jgi:hypothetical protein
VKERFEKFLKRGKFLKGDCRHVKMRYSSFPKNKRALGSQGRKKSNFNSYL